MKNIINSPNIILTCARPYHYNTSYIILFSSPDSDCIGTYVIRQGPIGCRAEYQLCVCVCVCVQATIYDNDDATTVLILYVLLL